MMRPPARKSLGQNFLHDPAVIARIIATIAPQPDDVFVEIGGGHGALTFPLAEQVAKLHVIELDRELAARLGDRCKSYPAMTVHHANALKFDLAPLATSGPLRIAGNLPYNISTPLLFRLLEQRDVIADMHLMLQKEVVQRMCAAPGGKEYGRLTVMLGAAASAKRCFDIGPGAFTPAPRVWSSIVRILPHATPPFELRDRKRFADVVARLFSMRRKTLARSLKGLLDESAITALGLDPRARPETLQPADFARLADAIAGAES
jgi:16S rRNA (adenine1518-N6/adenine1519-N6)-dimethyltransferase